MKPGSIKCFYLEPTDQVRVWLRRYLSGDDDTCSVERHGYHQAMTLLGDRPAVRDEKNHNTEISHPLDDPRWPTRCPCGFSFLDSHTKQVFQRQLYRRTDTGEIMTIEDAPIGAMWNAWWMGDTGGWHGGDGLSLMVKTPGGEWFVDGPCNNCTMPEDRAQLLHHCWVRHGTVPDITVDKNGKTCNAGAGSIMCGSYHGFLRNGYLENC